jgi:hypothetical protein
VQSIIRDNWVFNENTVYNMYIIVKVISKSKEDAKLSNSFFDNYSINKYSIDNPTSG